MAHTLSDLQIARLVGSQSFSRGERYAEDGYVSRATWAPSGTRVYGSVKGSGAHSYIASVSFDRDRNGTLSHPVGSCTCPVAINCKHVAALLLVARASAGEERSDGFGGAESPPTRAVHFTTDAGVPPRPPTHGAFAPMQAPQASSWQKTLAALTLPSSADTRATVALQFELLPPARQWRSSPSREHAPRLGIRPMMMGKRDKWIKGNLNWYSFSNPGGGFNMAQGHALNRLCEAYTSGRGYYAYLDEWAFLEDFGGDTLWELLTDARAAGVVFIGADAAQSAIGIAGDTARLSVDIVRTNTDCELRPGFTLGAEPLDRRKLVLLGSPAHGIASWLLPRDAPLGDAQIGLAALEAPIGPGIRELATAGSALVVPLADEPLFLASYYPFLRQQLTLTSSDGSFELIDAPRPRLVLSISTQPGNSVNLDWCWLYVPDAAEHTTPSTPAVERSLRAQPNETGYRDAEAEAEVLASLEGLLERFPALADGHGNATRLAETSSLADASMIEFLASELPLLHASDAITVVFTETMPDYREAEEAPLISVATHERPGERDWFDLAVEVTVDGAKIPFDELFTALASDAQLMILPDGVWFSLDRPELHQLRRLIEEARSLQDSAALGLGISRFQADLWEELQELGIVTAQAEAWRSAVAGLAQDAEIVARPLPATVNATLRGYQQEGFNWLSFLYDQGLGGVLADDMGLGKTLQAIALIAHTRQGEAGDAAATPSPFLVVAPTSVVPNWASECAKFAPSLKVATITATSGKRAQPLADLVADADVVITSYTLFRLDFEEYNRQEWAGLLLDEAQFVKNHQSRAHQCARRLNTPFKLAITGTPLENNLMELWSLFSITAPGLFPSPKKFADFYQKSIEGDGNDERLAQLRRRIRPFMMRRTKDQVATELPAKQEQVLELELHPRHRKVYQTHLQRERQKVLGLIDDMNANRFEIFRSLTMLRQLSLDASLYDEKYADIPSTKLDALLELLADTVAEGHRTLIFSQFTGYLAKARSRLDAAGIAYSYLDGKTRNRAKAIADFKDGANPVFLISLKAGGFGLNLTEADYVILLDPWWNPATEAQAVDRTHRIGQTKNVMVYRLVSKDTIEEKVMALKASKSKLFDSVMTDGAASGAALSVADIRSLLE